MKDTILKELINFILVIIFTAIYIIYCAPKIIDYTNSIFLSVGIWLIIVGVWGQAVGMRIVKAVLPFKDYNKENYTIIGVGIILILIGLLKSYLI